MHLSYVDKVGCLKKTPSTVGIEGAILEPVLNRYAMILIFDNRIIVCVPDAL
jgi:hypothetical protein